MKLGKIALKIRLANTTFGNFVAGAAEFAYVQAASLTKGKDMAFVIPLVENTDPNKYDAGIQQSIIERFGIVVAIANDTSQKDKTGILAYDRLHEVRNELLTAICGWDIREAETQIYYRGARLLDVDSGHLWYQFEFEYASSIISEAKEDGMRNVVLFERDIDEDEGTLPVPFTKFYANLIQSPNAEFPYTEELPLDDNFPDVTLPNMALWIDETDDPRRGAFGKAFGEGYKTYDEDRRM